MWVHPGLDPTENSVIQIAKEPDRRNQTSLICRTICKWQISQIFFLACPEAEDGIHLGRRRWATGRPRLDDSGATLASVRDESWIPRTRALEKNFRPRRIPRPARH